MAKRLVKDSGKSSEVNGEGNEKDDNTSSTKAELSTLSTQDNNAKIAGLAKGGQSHPN